MPARVQGPLQLQHVLVLLRVQELVGEVDGQAVQDEPHGGGSRLWGLEKKREGGEGRVAAELPSPFVDCRTRARLAPAAEVLLQGRAESLRGSRACARLRGRGSSARPRACFESGRAPAEAEVRALRFSLGSCSAPLSFSCPLKKPLLSLSFSLSMPLTVSSPPMEAAATRRSVRAPGKAGMERVIERVSVPLSAFLASEFTRPTLPLLSPLHTGLTSRPVTAQPGRALGIAAPARASSRARTVRRIERRQRERSGADAARARRSLLARPHPPPSPSTSLPPLLIHPHTHSSPPRPPPPWPPASPAPRCAS